MFQLPAQSQTSILFYEQTAFRFVRDHARTGRTYNSEIHGYGELGVDGAIKKAIHVMQELHKLTEQYGIKLSVAVYPGPGQVLFDVEDSKQVQIWKKFCENKCKKFYDFMDPFFELKIHRLNFLLYLISRVLRYSKYQHKM